MGVAWWGCAIFGSRTIPLAAVAHQVENIFRFLAKMTFLIFYAFYLFQNVSG